MKKVASNSGRYAMEKVKLKSKTSAVFCKYTLHEYVVLYTTPA